MQINFEEINYAKTSPFLCFTLEAGLPIRTFGTFKSIIDEFFATSVVVEAQPYSQVLIYTTNLHFASIFSNHILITRKSPIITLTKAKLDDVMARENEILQKIKQVMAFIGMSPTKKRSLADWIFGPSLCE